MMHDNIECQADVMLSVLAHCQVWPGDHMWPGEGQRGQHNHKPRVYKSRFNWLKRP